MPCGARGVARRASLRNGLCEQMWCASALPKSRPNHASSGRPESPAGLPAGVGRGCSVGRQPQAAPAFPCPEGDTLRESKGFCQAGWASGKHLSRPGKGDSLRNPLPRMGRNTHPFARAIPFVTRSRAWNATPLPSLGRTASHHAPPGVPQGGGIVPPLPLPQRLPCPTKNGSETTSAQSKNGVFLKKTAKIEAMPVDK